MPNTYNIGDAARISTDPSGFTDKLTGLATDPTTVTLIIQEPQPDGKSGGKETTYTGGSLVHPSTGKYYYDLTLTKAGSWFYRWKGAGSLVVAGEGELHVRKSAFKKP